jgi:hypothetical protein
MLHRRIHWSLLVALSISGAIPSIVFAQPVISPLKESERRVIILNAENLNTQVSQLYKQGRYAEAIPLAEKASALWESLLGAEDIIVASSLNTLGLLYNEQS